MNTFAFRFRQSRSCRWRSVSRKVCGVAHAVKTRWFDSENRVAGYAFTNSLGRGVTATLAYDGSRMSGMTFVLLNGGTFSTTLTRNAARPDLVTRRAYSASGCSIYSYDTTFDLLGRPVNATDSQSLARSYLYNKRNELAAATIGTNAYEYAYDTIGNRTAASANSATNTYAANNLNQYAQVDASQLTYDHDGRLIAFDAGEGYAAQTITYRPDGKIAAISTADAVVSYTYGEGGFETGYSLSVVGGATFTRTVLRDPFRRGMILEVGVVHYLMHKTGSILDAGGISCRVGAIQSKVELEVGEVFLKLQEVFEIDHLVVCSVRVMCIICARRGAIPAPPPTHIISALLSKLGKKSP